jgi:imidazole glycerol-phosphate synthase subunit HisH
MIVIVDYGMGNVGSIQNMLKKTGFESVVSRDRDIVESAEKIILPGVGAFDAAMNTLHDLNIIELLHHKVVEQKTPMLGICLGMQLLAASSEEGEQMGLGWIDATVRKFPAESNLKIPHMGWNVVFDVRRNKLFADMHKEELRYYFVHSYYVDCQETDAIIGETEYGVRFTSAVNKDNIWGVQFHPEKSHKFGMQLLKNFAEV